LKKSDIGDIERCLRKLQTIYTPNEYAVAVRKARKVNPFKVHEMQNVDFVTMDPVMECITQRTTTSEGCKVQFCNITQLMVCQNDPWLLHFRHSHHDTTWQTISLRKRGRQRTLTRLSLPQKYAQACALPKNKVTDVQSLLEYIPPIPHTFFNAINIDVHVPLTAVECIDPETDGDY